MVDAVTHAGEYAGKRIVWLRGQKVLLDFDLANLYGVTTARLNEQVKRNAARFPPDFAFRLTNHEFSSLMSHFATSKNGRGGRRKKPMAFTEHGALMAASVLNSGHALHDRLAADTNSEFRRVIQALREPMSPPVGNKRSIGFVTPK